MFLSNDWTNYSFLFDLIVIWIETQLSLTNVYEYGP